MQQYYMYTFLSKLYCKCVLKPTISTIKTTVINDINTSVQINISIITYKQILPEGTKIRLGSPRQKKESSNFLALISWPIKQLFKTNYCNDHIINVCIYIHMVPLMCHFTLAREWILTIREYILTTRKSILATCESMRAACNMLASTDTSVSHYQCFIQWEVH